MKKKQIQFILLVSIIAIVSVFFVPVMPQSIAYHNFVDKRNMFNITNFFNVFSNLPFIIIGVLGILKTTKIVVNCELKTHYYVFFIGILLTGFGSAYYHYNPNNTTLIWDRLPMTISFMSFISIVIVNFVNNKVGFKYFVPLLIIGFFSVLYWVIFDDLRIYILVQFLPILLIPIILLLSDKHKTLKTFFWQILTFYLLAKLSESNDEAIYNFFNKQISGHSIKHLFAAVAPLVFCVYLDKKYKTITNV